MTKFIWDGEPGGFDSFLSEHDTYRSLGVLQRAEDELKLAQDAILDVAVGENRALLAKEQTELEALKLKASKVRGALNDATLQKQERDAKVLPLLAGGDGQGRSGSATARGSLRTDTVYRPDGERSFFRDMIMAKREPAAAERIAQSQAEARAIASGDVGGLVPPQYLNDIYAEFPRGARPFADVLPKQDLPPDGMSLIIPRMTGGVTVAPMGSENSSVSETSPTETDLNVPVVTIAGQVDLSRQSLERSYPGLDQVVFADLYAAYDQKLDTQLLSGAGSGGEHLGIRTVSGVNSTTYTDASPTGAELIPVIYNAIQKVGSTRFRNPDTLVMHPRRAAWLSKELSASFPLIQQGQLFQAVGTQDGGFLQTFAGLKVVVDPNVGTTYGAGTNQDEIYIVYSRDLFLLEAPVRALTFEDVGSGTLTVRLQAFAYSGFASGRQPLAISVIQGTGLVAPSF